MNTCEEVASQTKIITFEFKTLYEVFCWNFPNFASNYQTSNICEKRIDLSSETAFATSVLTTNLIHNSPKYL